MSVHSDLRPSDYEYALLSKQVYNTGKTTPKVGSDFTTHTRKWSVVSVKDSPSGYFAAVYRCDASKQFVIASRGASSIADLYEGVQGILLNKCTAQKEDAFSLVDAVVKNIQEQRLEYRLSFTGHSLGGFLSELCVYYAHHSLNFTPVNAVTFESPGAKQSLELLVRKLGKYETMEEDLQTLDTVGYLCYPNLVNSSKEHIGSVYGINVEVSGGVLASVPGMRILGNHKLDEIVNFFHNTCVQRDQNCKRYFMLSWPKGYNQLDAFLKYAELNKEGIYTLQHDEIDEDDSNLPVTTITEKSHGFLPRSVCKLDLNDHKPEETFPNPPPNPPQPQRNTNKSKLAEWLEGQKCQKVVKYFKKVRVLESLSSFQSIPMRHFTEDMQIFLKHFHDKLHLVYGNDESQQKTKQETLISMWKGFSMPEDIRNLLLSFTIRSNSAELEELVCFSKVFNVHEFRTEISSYLKKSGFSVEDLIYDSLLLPPFPGRNSIPEVTTEDNSVAETNEHEGPDFTVSNGTPVSE